MVIFSNDIMYRVNIHMIQTEEKKMKKILAIFLSASLVMASVTGCSSRTGGNQVQSETEGQKAESQEAVPDTQSRTEYTF